MDITVTLTRADYTKAQKYVTRRMLRGSPWRFVSFGWNLLVGLLFGIGFMLIYRSAERLCASNHTPLIVGLALAAVSVVTSIMSVYLFAFASRRVVFRDGGASLSPQSFSVTDGGLLHRYKSSECKTAWSDIDAVEEDSNYVYFFHDRGLATFIPRRAFSTPSACGEFVALVRSHVAPQG